MRLLVAMLLLCYTLPLHPRRLTGPAHVAVANDAHTLQLPLPPNPGWLVSPVLWLLRQVVGRLKQPWDPRHHAWVGTTCLGVVSGNTNRRHDK